MELFLYFLKSIETWKSHAQVYLGDNEFTKINYNEWVQSADYRKGLCETNRWMFTDDGFEEVSSYGNGSSFDKMSHNGAASSMKVLERYKQFDISEYVDEELIYYGKRIFDIEWKK